MIVLVSWIVLLWGFPCVSTIFRMVHPIPTSPFIQIFGLVPYIFDGSRIKAATRMRTCVG